ncbi:MAG TPA: hypothetical protein PLH43_01735 [Acetivibrio sp.]|uniref:hypothetical protein n=1 Tax=Acetivibrio sp. TaxID=1872092 RepID=UPI002C9B0A5B|nr:hypothetical protein [Acetivibrio sp.]HOM01535.1 hypothetical protein [Acetivibrio sp.]
MYSQSNLSLDWDAARVDSIYELEMLHLKDMSNYIYNFLLPNLQKSYKHAKQYLPGNARKNIYSMQKYLADMISDYDFVKLSISEDIGSDYLTKYEALFLLTESLNMIYFFSAVAKSKIKTDNSEHKLILRNLMKLTSEVHKEISFLME